MQHKIKIWGLIASLFIVSNSFSQLSNVGNVQPFVQKTSYNKDFTNVVIEFQKRFSNAENVTWYQLKKNFVASFTMNDLKYRVHLDRKGRLKYKITYANEKHLPVDIRKLVKSDYVEFGITGTYLVEEFGREIWVVDLEDDSRYVTVSVEGNEIIETLNINKKS